MSGVKRSSSSEETASKKRKSSRPLDGWLNVDSVKRPMPFGISSPLQDKDSTFIAYAALAESVQDIKRTREYVVEQANGEYRPDEPASHVAHGARFLSLIQGKSGLNESHFEVALHLENDGEDRAGRTIVDALAGANACDVVVCVSRWFGGSFLGPRRFDDIRKVALEALYALRDQEEIFKSVQDLKIKDQEIRGLLKELSSKAGTAMPSATGPENYDALDLAKTRRLQIARDLRIGNLQLKLEKVRDETEENHLPDLPEMTSVSTFTKAAEFQLA